MHQLILTKSGGPYPYVDPAPEKVGVNWPPGPRGPWIQPQNMTPITPFYRPMYAFALAA